MHCVVFPKEAEENGDQDNDVEEEEDDVGEEEDEEDDAEGKWSGLSQC